MEEPVEDSFHTLATLLDPFCEFPAIGTFDFSLHETSCPKLSEVIGEGTIGAVPTVDDVASIGGVGPDDIFETSNSGVQAVPSGPPLLGPPMSEVIDENSICVEFNELSSSNLAFSGDLQPQLDAFLEPIQDPYFFVRCLDADPMVQDGTVVNDDNFDYLSIDLNVEDAVPEVSGKAVLLPSSLNPTQISEELDRAETDINPSLSTRTTCDPSLKGKSILRAWFESHDYPYPKLQELEELVQASGLSRKQVRTFFTNIRTRSWKSTDQSRRKQLSTHSLNELEGLAEKPGLQSLALGDPVARFASKSLFPVQYPEANRDLEEVVAGDADGRSSSQESSYKVEAGSKQKLSPIPSFETLTSSADSDIINDGMPLTRRRLLTWTQKLKKESSDLPTVERLSVQRFLAEHEYAADTENIKKAIGETMGHNNISQACNRYNLMESKCDSANLRKNFRVEEATCVYDDGNRSHNMDPVSEDGEVASNRGNTTSIVHGFSPSTLAEPTAPKPLKRQQPKFILGGSSEGSSIGVRSILSSASKRSDRDNRHGKIFKVTSFNNEVSIRRYSSEVAIESDSDEDFSDEVVYDDDEDDDWEDDDNSISSKPDPWNMIPKASKPAAVPGATSPRTMRRNMLATELTESLRQNLLSERGQTQKNTGYWSSKEPSSPPAKRRKSTSLASRHSSRASAASASSYAISAMSGTSSTPGRKGKRRWSQTLLQRDDDKSKTTQRAENSRKTVYECTFCWKPCKDRYAWSRHEDTHVEPESWTCMPEGVTVVLGVCVFCSGEPQLSHKRTLGQRPGSPDTCHCHESQHVTNCLIKQLEERTFSTKDGLKGHIRRMHNTEGVQNNPPDKARIDPLVTHWFRTKSPHELRSDALWCGFCEENFGTWKARVDHVATHFREQCRPNHWQHWKPSPTLNRKQDADNAEAARELCDNQEDEAPATQRQKQKAQNREAQMVIKAQAEQRIRELEGELAYLKSIARHPASDDDHFPNPALPHISNDLHGQFMLPSLGYFDDSLWGYPTE